MRCFIFTIQGLMYGESYESVFIILFFNFIAGRMYHDEVFFRLPSKDSFLMNQYIGMYIIIVDEDKYLAPTIQIASFRNSSLTDEQRMRTTTDL